MGKILEQFLKPADTSYLKTCQAFEHEFRSTQEFSWQPFLVGQWLSKHHEQLLASWHFHSRSDSHHRVYNSVLPRLLDIYLKLVTVLDYSQQLHKAAVRILKSTKAKWRHTENVKQSQDQPASSKALVINKNTKMYRQQNVTLQIGEKLLCK